MSDQPTLFDAGQVAVSTLSDRLQTAHRILTSHRDGLYPAELGALVHDARGYHRQGGTCKFCDAEGRSCLRSLEQRGLAMRDKHGRWRAGKPADGGYDPQTAAIPF